MLRRLSIALLACGCGAASRELPPAGSTPAIATESAKPATQGLVASESEYQGWRYYHLYCARCHGQDALGAAAAPDLRQSIAPGRIARDSFFVLVRDGSTENEEMPAHREVLEDDRIHQVYDYVKARAALDVRPLEQLGGRLVEHLVVPQLL
jgi:mono/diheme cytochrome c family protein